GIAQAQCSSPAATAIEPAPQKHERLAGGATFEVKHAFDSGIDDADTNGRQLPVASAFDCQFAQKRSADRPPFEISALAGKDGFQQVLLGGSEILTARKCTVSHAYHPLQRVTEAQFIGNQAPDGEPSATGGAFSSWPDTWIRLVRNRR